ncbi:16S rRNA (cytidine(1402)-2'-O)-methyltransferase [Paenibacillus senegalensis]|uniref:16S rRNA (cytidine(1402)-2'-O)-methyltransferase n=1 Tax=Paenibacillus senegalensis TaxID=1465766 RepID=UPI000289B5D8|nr:16S rRNA (cytidine(1402)-2'-O)-methyltransferase [Paenibacillus senegalensis]
MTFQVQKSFQPHDGKGCLYLVATPIGNLEDMTFRAVRILKEADWIAAEDTRQTRKLLTHFDISSRVVSYHEHNKKSSGAELIEKLELGQSVALVSDAGLPSISDPGYDLVQSAIAQQIPVIPVPGANAALSALIVSGLATDRFVFIGFLPRDQKSLKKELERWQGVPATLLVYESPHRVKKTLEAIYKQWGNRRIALVRELTKRYEEVIRGTALECMQWLDTNPPLGEYCIVIEQAGKEELEQLESVWWEEYSLEEHLEHYMEQGEDKKAAMKCVAKDRGMSKRDVYNSLL